jgi:hypothetical protein
MPVKLTTLASVRGITWLLMTSFTAATLTRVTRER